jgi:hypothetical protein
MRAERQRDAAESGQKKPRTLWNFGGTTEIMKKIIGLGLDL